MGNQNRITLWLLYLIEIYLDTVQDGKLGRQQLEYLVWCLLILNRFI